MRSETITTDIFTFDELSPEAQARAIESHRQTDYENGEPLYFFADNAAERAAEKGFKNIDLQYSLNYSQGDGLSFSCKDFDLKTFLQNLNFTDI